MKKLLQTTAACTIILWSAAASTHAQETEAPPSLEPWRLKLYEDWKSLAEPPITPYTGPFSYYARAFVPPSQPYAIGKYKETHPEIVKQVQALLKAGEYTVEKDPRPINLEFEAAKIDDFRRMGYNTAYKQGFHSGRYLKQHGMLGAIDQTLWNIGSGPGSGGAMDAFGNVAPTPREGCGSFFLQANHDLGVKKISGMVLDYGELDMVKVGDTYITCSWDEVGMRTRSRIDYRPEAVAEYRKYLRDVWFMDDSPAADSNGDGRTYNQFTQENLKTWDDVKPPLLTPQYAKGGDERDEKWSRTGAYKLWIDFHRYYTFEFFRRINRDASQRVSMELAEKKAEQLRAEGKPVTDEALAAAAAHRVECYPFPQAFIMWPGMGCHWGMSMYWNARLNPIVNIEQCWPDSPAMSLNYAMTDRLVRKYKNLVMGWTWFYFADEGSEMYNGPYDNGRALARMMGHRVDGIHHWLYSPVYRGRDRHQRKQIAYWHSFLGHHYQTFLARSAPPVPEVALLMPDYTGFFYGMYQYPKADWAYFAAGLQEAQIPYEIVTEEELELDPETLAPYKVLCVIGSEWSTPTIRRRIQAFLDDGGMLLANVDSLSLDIPTGERTDFVERVLGARVSHKYKNSFYPSAQNAEEESWARKANACASLQGHDVHKPGVYSQLYKDQNGKPVRDEAAWEKLDAAMAEIPREVRGIKQSPLDMRTPPRVRYADHVGTGEPIVTWGEIDTAEVVRGKPIAWYGDAVCGVETENTVWFGTRPGMSLHAISPRMSMNRVTEPCNPYVTEVDPSYAPHKPYVDVISYIARKAGIQRLAVLKQDGAIPCNIEVLPRVAQDGTLMVIAVNHEDTEGTYQMEVDNAYLEANGLNDAEAWSMLDERLIETSTDGKFDIQIGPGGAAVIMIGKPGALNPVKQVQAKLNAKDLSVPQYFLDRPELNQAPWNTPIPEIEQEKR